MRITLEHLILCSCSRNASGSSGSSSEGSTHNAASNGQVGQVLQEPWKQILGHGWCSGNKCMKHARYYGGMLPPPPP